MPLNRTLRAPIAFMTFVSIMSVSAMAQAQTAPADILGPIAKEVTATLDRALALTGGARQQATTIRQRSRDAAVEMMKDVHAMSVAYEKRIKQSRTIEATEFFFESLRSGVKAARATARDSVSDPAVSKQLDLLTELLGKIAVIYEDAH